MTQEERKPIVDAARDLLARTPPLIKRNKEIIRLRQENFNIFAVLGMENREVKLHSRLIAELLNPQGAHELGAVFLELFIDCCCPDMPNFFPVGSNSDAIVAAERSTGSGRVDIYIENKQNNDVICIENKIYARDQHNQLMRYRQDLDNLRGNGSRMLFYLTLDGHKPSSDSITGSNGKELAEGKDYHIISYHNHILKWLKDCLKEAVSTPTVRETIQQYITLIKKLTNQLEDVMKEDFKQLLTQPENFEAWIELRDKMPVIVEEEEYEFVQEIGRRVCKALGDGWQIEHDMKYRTSYILFETWQDIRLAVNISLYGIWVASPSKWRGNSPDESRREITKKLGKVDISKFAGCDFWIPINTPLFATHKEKALLFDAVKRAERIKQVANDLIELGKSCRDAFAEA